MVKQLIHKTIKEFLGSVTDDDIYNEFSMQHELGIRLRKEFEEYNTNEGRNFVVQFERNRKYFNIVSPINEKNASENIPKSEIDIVVYDRKKTEDKTKWEKYAIELKYPLNKQYPQQMHSFIEDICFCEKLVNNPYNNFDGAFAVVLVNDKGFYEKENDNSAPYCYFRYGTDIPKGEYKKPGTKNTREKSFELLKQHKIEWKDAKKIQDKDKRAETCGKYYIISIDKRR